ncbi:hypothetical protein [Streptomyces olivochromogenes]|uniref:hypothetical protein n=1 Tax=Streptomyces olivochromogenes TaxID=1963 RepID=UPI001F1B67CE|nr:hypothetical protein [Streptomyces olivochromogenes]MCF3131967.1 hypothetical protein [Streptomyces olivochromogenes]
MNMPTEDALPPGPLRQVLSDLHKLYYLAGTPGLREISSGIAEMDLPAMLNRNLVSDILSGKKQPNALQLESLVRFFSSRAANGPDPEVESNRLVSILLDANFTPEYTMEADSSSLSIEASLREASSRGTAEPLIRACADRSPATILLTLTEIKARNWHRFLKQVENSLAETFSPANIPALVAELRLARDHTWVAERTLSRFGALRSVEDVTETMRLLWAVGSTGDASTVLHAFVRFKKPGDAARLYKLLLSLHIHPWKLRDNRLRENSFTSGVTEFALLLNATVDAGDVAMAVRHWLGVGVRGIESSIEYFRICAQILGIGNEELAETLAVLVLSQSERIRSDLEIFLSSETPTNIEKNAMRTLITRKDVQTRTNIARKEMALNKKFGIVETPRHSP